MGKLPSRLASRSFFALWLLPLLFAAPALSQKPGDLNQIVTVTMDDGRPASVTTRPIPEAAFSKDFVPAPKPSEPPAAAPDKIHPQLREMLERHGPSENVLIIINFRDTLKIPPFPDPVPGEPRTSPANQERLLRSAELVETLKAKRAEIHRRRMAEIGPRFSAEFLESFWLIDAILVRMPLGSVRGLARRPDVLYVEPQESGEAPPIGDGNALNDVIDGREKISSDPYFNLGLTSGFIGMLDTGMRFTHVQFNNPSHISFRRDCVNGTSDYCATGTGLDPTDNCWNHGTSTGAILTANSIQGNDYRGVTGITVDSFKIYSCPPGGLDAAATVRGFEAAVAAADRTIVAEIQATGSDSSAISTAADSAFDAGTAVIAANGNNGPNPSTVNAPANAHKVIGVGAVDVATLAFQTYQSRGPAPDDRIKPDIQAPTNTETASNASDTALHVFTGTSGSTPYAGGVAALFRNWLISQGDNGSPGQVYAHMILSGQTPSFNNDSGAGLVVMPTGGTLWRGSVSITTGQTINIPLAITGTLSRLDGALWWPESVTQSHNDVDMYLVSPTGTEYSSVSTPSVFERARATGSISGNWTLRITGYAVPAGPQIVYWAAHAK